ncbi:hypothetical protein K438DRAFT_1876535, partial [Mycena galopus ATCC 62051]
MPNQATRWLPVATANSLFIIFLAPSVGLTPFVQFATDADAAFHSYTVLAGNDSITRCSTSSSKSSPSVPPKTVPISQRKLPAAPTSQPQTS